MPVSAAPIRRLLRLLFALLAVGSTLLALTLVVGALAPDRILVTPTIGLVCILALLVLPTASVAAWAWDRNVQRKFGPSATARSAEPAREHPAGRRRPHAAQPTTHQQMSPRASQQTS
ncbi:MAG: hypothetical protein AAFR96_02475 [Planctomycetota bacterium]